MSVLAVRRYPRQIAALCAVKATSVSGKPIALRMVLSYGDHSQFPLVSSHDEYYDDLFLVSFPD